MHRSVRNDDKCAGDHGETDNIVPIGKGIKAKCAQDRCARHFDIQAVLVVNQSEEGNLVDNQGFKAIVEY